MLRDFKIESRTILQSSIINRQSSNRQFFMSLLESFITAIVSLQANRMRSLLTMLGIIVGVAAVIAVVALGEGARFNVNERLKGLGSNLLFVRPGAANVGRTALAAGSSVRLKDEDAEILTKKSSAIQETSPELSRNAQVKFLEKNANTSVVGSLTNYPAVRNFKLSEGRYFTAVELQSRSKVCILGAEVRQELFGNASAVGQIIKINGQNSKSLAFSNEKEARVFKTRTTKSSFR